MDVPDILLVVQWRVTCRVAALWQRFGHAVQDKGLTGTALLFVEKEYFDNEKAKVAGRAQSAADTADNDSSTEEESDDEETNTPPETSSNNASSTPGATLLLEVALATWAGSLSRMAQSGRRGRRKLDPGLDFLINAEAREGIVEEGEAPSSRMTCRC